MSPAMPTAPRCQISSMASRSVGTEQEDQHGASTKRTPLERRAPDSTGSIVTSLGRDAESSPRRRVAEVVGVLPEDGADTSTLSERDVVDVDRRDAVLSDRVAIVEDGAPVSVPAQALSLEAHLLAGV